nr:galactose-1-epimerase [Haliscomenobacter sp.]
MKSKQKTLIGLALLGLITLGCQSKPKEKSSTMDEAKSESAAVYALPDPQKFNTTHEGKAIKLFILKNGPIQAAITNYGARMVGMLVPDKA